jgi:hypothetical protein
VETPSAMPGIHACSLTVQVPFAYYRELRRTGVDCNPNCNPQVLVRMAGRSQPGAVQRAGPNPRVCPRWACRQALQRLNV